MSKPNVSVAVTKCEEKMEVHADAVYWTYWTVKYKTTALIFYQNQEESDEENSGSNVDQDVYEQWMVDYLIGYFIIYLFSVNLPFMQKPGN